MSNEVGDEEQERYDALDIQIAGGNNTRLARIDCIVDNVGCYYECPLDKSIRIIAESVSMLRKCSGWDRTFPNRQLFFSIRWKMDVDGSRNGSGIGASRLPLSRMRSEIMKLSICGSMRRNLRCSSSTDANCRMKSRKLLILQ